VVIINVHLSEGRELSAYDVVQPPRDPSESPRIVQVRAGRDYVQALPADERRPVVILGDCNAYWH
jgi:predicted extracellular nuclease